MQRFLTVPGFLAGAGICFALSIIFNRASDVQHVVSQHPGRAALLGIGWVVFGIVGVILALLALAEHKG